jgi:hypothetical protein
MTIQAGDIVRIKPEYQDKGDDRFVWLAVEDADGDRVRIKPITTELAFTPNHVVLLSMLEGG